jgi:hypothetical protein
MHHFDARCIILTCENDACVKSTRKNNAAVSIFPQLFPNCQYLCDSSPGQVNQLSVSFPNCFLTVSIFVTPHQDRSNKDVEESQGITKAIMLPKRVLQSVQSILQEERAPPVVEVLLWTIYTVLFLQFPLHLLDTFLEAIQEATVDGSSVLGVLFPY